MRDGYVGLVTPHLNASHPEPQCHKSYRAWDISAPPRKSMLGWSTKVRQVACLDRSHKGTCSHFLGTLSETRFSRWDLTFLYALLYFYKCVEGLQFWDRYACEPKDFMVRPKMTGESIYRGFFCCTCTHYIYNLSMPLLTYGYRAVFLVMLT